MPSLSSETYPGASNRATSSSGSCSRASLWSSTRSARTRPSSGGHARASRSRSRSYAAHLLPEGIRAEALYRLGQYDEAELATRTSEATASVDDVFSQGWWRKVRAKVAARRNDVDLALNLSNGAVECLRASDSIDLHGDVLIDRAEVLRIAGRPKEAAESVTGALRLYRQKENVVSTERAEALLDEVSDGGTRAR
jgi:tetratricopeptide (TPR) repeat protein